MLYKEVLISGFGGQGVLSIGNFLVQAGMGAGLNVSWYPSYGPEMRGGTANCSVVLGEVPIISPLVLEPSELIAMNQPSLDKFEKNVQKGGTIFVNSSVVEGKVSRDDVKAIYVPCVDIASELGNIRVANMVMLGAYIEATGVLKQETLIGLLPEIFTGKKASLIDLNEEAIKRGAACAREQ